MIVSPVPTNMPNVTRKLNTVTVKLRDTLEPNTTYSINFGNTIKDVNEGNMMKEFTYTFSTVPILTHWNSPAMCYWQKPVAWIPP